MLSEMALIQQGLATARELEEDPPSPPTLDYDDSAWETVRVYKHSVDVSLGLRFMDPSAYESGILQTEEGVTQCVVESLVPGSIAETVLQPGDRVVAIEGEVCSGPADAAQMLRSLDGYVRLEVLHDALGRNKHAHVRTPSKKEDAVESDMSLSDDEADKTVTGSSSSSSPDGTPRPTGAHSPDRPAAARQQPRPTTGAFHLDLPHDSAANLAVVGNKGHLRLSKQGSSGRLLKSKGLEERSPRSPLSPSLSARMRQIGTMLSPRA